MVKNSLLIRFRDQGERTHNNKFAIGGFRAKNSSVNLSKNESKIIFILSLIIIPTISYSQSDPEYAIFHKIVENEIRSEAIFLQCQKLSTLFESEKFNEQNGSDVPINILEELQEASKTSIDTVWESSYFQKLNFGKEFIKNESCLTTTEVRKLYEEAGKRQTMLSITNPIFDSEQQHCVVSVVYQKYIGSAHGQSYFLKKVYGVWTIIFIYDYWIS